MTQSHSQLGRLHDIASIGQRFHIAQRRGAAIADDMSDAEPHQHVQPAQSLLPSQAERHTLTLTHISHTYTLHRGCERGLTLQNVTFMCKTYADDSRESNQGLPHKQTQLAAELVVTTTNPALITAINRDAVEGSGLWGSLPSVNRPGEVWTHVFGVQSRILRGCVCWHALGPHTRVSWSVDVGGEVRGGNPHC